MTYTDVTKQSPETQAAIEQEVRLLLKVSYHIIIIFVLSSCDPLTPPLLFSRTPMIVLRTS